MILKSTLSIQDACSQSWDAIVIGAGPAGAVAARQLVLAGKRVLLLDKATFPRPKVCGGCVSWKARRILDQVGLDIRDLPQGFADQLRLTANGRSARLPMAPVSVISREPFDAFLLSAAIQAGVAFVGQTSAMVGTLHYGLRQVLCREPHSESLIARAPVVIAADGLAHSSLSRLPEMNDRVASASYIGLGAIVHETPAWLDSVGLEQQTVNMVLGREGYVGLARSPEGRLHVAAAISPSLVAASGRPTEAIGAVLNEGGVPEWAARATEHWPAANWSGTPRLSHRLTCVAHKGVFVVGDAAVYSEPFTGEGICWALQSATDLSSLLAVPGTWSLHDTELQWRKRQRRFLQRQIVSSRVLTSLLRSPRLTGLSIQALNAVPNVAAWLAWFFNGFPSADQFAYADRAYRAGTGHATISNRAAGRLPADDGDFVR